MCKSWHFFYFPRTSAIALNLYLMTSKEAYKLQWLIRIKSLLQTNVGLTIKVIKLQSVWNTPTPKFVTMILELYNSITRSDLESSCMQEIKGSH